MKWRSFTPDYRKASSVAGFLGTNSDGVFYRRNKEDMGRVRKDMMLHMQYIHMYENHMGKL